MLSRFFSSSQPFHYLVGILLLGPFSIGLLWFLDGMWQWSLLIIGIILPLALLLVQFIILKNELTGQNSYGLFAYTMLTLSLVIVGIQMEFALCLLLLLLSLRRLLSLKTGTQTIRKIFDGTFWICIATLIHPVMVFFLFVIFTAIFLFDRTKWRHWVIPFVAMGCVVTLSITLEILLEIEILTQLLYVQAYEISGMLQQWQPGQLIAWLMAAAAVIGFVIYIVKLVDIQQRVRPRFSVLTVAGICALVLGLLFDVAYILLLVPVLAIFQVRALEHIRHKGLREFIFLVPALLVILAIFLR